MKNIFVILIQVLFFSFFVNNVFSTPVNYWFERANKFYEQQQYDSASLYYEKILQSGITNSGVYYNLGNCYFRLKMIGLSVLNYEKALKLSPNDQDIIANLKFVNSLLIDKIPEPEKPFLEAIFSKFHNTIPLNIQLIVIFIILLILSIMFSFFLFVSSNSRLWIIYIACILALILLPFCISAGLKIYATEKIFYAIVLTPSLDAKNEPNGNKLIFTVHEGTKLKIVKTLGEWSLVSLPNGISGWVQDKNIGKI